ncbi:MAG: type II toxin-antitoxin system HicA family toxin [Comamonadaceae bacterium]|nr:type II toxin-antitoxin system HicA family toxin [Comamonadaceae bacterium]
MSQFEKLLLRLLRGTSDNSIGFQELCGLLAHLGFQMHTRGSHHVFSKLGVAELINHSAMVRTQNPYQVKQVRQVIVKYKLEV